MNASDMTLAQKRGVLACWEVLNKSARCAIDAAFFASSMTGHKFNLDADDLIVEFGDIPVTVSGYSDMSDPVGENEGVTLMLEHLGSKGWRNLGNAGSLRVKYERVINAAQVVEDSGMTEKSPVRSEDEDAV